MKRDYKRDKFNEVETKKKYGGNIQMRTGTHMNLKVKFLREMRFLLLRICYHCSEL
jgi:hypothetical protein